MINSSGGTILIVDDEEPIRRLLANQVEGLASVTAGSAEEAWEIFSRSEVDLLVTDLRLPGGDGISLLKRILSVSPDLPIIVLTAFGSIESAVEAMRLGAFDYLTKPVEMKVFRRTVEKALTMRRLREENRYLRERLDEAHLPEIIGASPEMVGIKRLLPEISSSSATVLITGESGTGKGLIARAIHEASGRSGPFVKVNCAALPASLLESELFGHVKGAFTGASGRRKGKFILAEGGTIFLDEIGTMPPELQAKLLHVLDDGEISPLGADSTVKTGARVIAASNEDLDILVKEGRFRPDLFYRLNVISISIPPLSARREDIPLLVQHFLARIVPDRHVTVSPEAVALLTSRSWPGNCRELENLLRRAVILNPTREVLPPEVFEEGIPSWAEGMTLKEALSRTERALLTEALKRAAGKKSRAADMLGISPRMISYYLDKYPELRGIARDSDSLSG